MSTLEVSYQSPEYTQINYKNKPVRVTPLQYGNWLKWFTNQSEGIPAYICIDMATQNAVTGDTISIEYQEGEKSHRVTKIVTE